MTPPPPRGDGPYRVALVCLGNICRSPMADVALQAAVEESGLAGVVEVESFGTAGWHVGKPMDRRAAATLTTHGYDASRHLARRLTAEELGGFDLVLAMDAANRTDVLALADALDEDARDRVLLFRDFDPLGTPDDREVPDPYYGDDDGFEHVLRIVQRTCAELVRRLEEGVGRPTGG